ncbi:MAG: NAD(+) diphosphatase [Actinomycetota bacterium]|nr:NAD(+) diphosphatase [Actinomycetota bacterium]
MFEPVTALPDHLRDAEGLWFCLRRSEVLVRAGDGGPEVPAGAAPPITSHTETLLLGVIGGHMPVWGVAWDDEPPAGHDVVDLRRLYGQIPEQHWILAGRAAQLLTWDRTHRFCGACASPTELTEGERARRCVACGHTAFPRLTPAVIMLVERGDEVLLAHGRQFPGRFFSALAGFVEPGETLEEAVAREVREEVSLEVRDVRYFGSQPWPFPHSLMVGFNATYESGEIEIDPEEIVEAGWYKADDLPPSPLGGMSIAGWLIKDWIDRVARGEVTKPEPEPEPEPEPAPSSGGSIWDRTAR